MDEGRGVVDLGSWFDSSCVVDASGAPLVMFHGTGADVGRHFRPLSFFSQSPEIAQIYALAPTRQVEGSGPNIVPCYLRILNPYMHDDQATGENLSHAVLGRRGTHLQVMDELLKRGHDGVLIKNYFDLGGLQDQWVIFDGSQALPVWCVSTSSDSHYHQRSCRPVHG